jgi:type IV pilus assembly protein PilW
MILNRQRGLSLVEMMVTLLIGCFLIIGISQIYIDNRGAHLFQQGQASNLSKSRFAVLILEDLIARAGYRANPAEDPSAVFAADTVGSCPFGGEEVVVANSQGTGICVRYQAALDAEAGSLERDCIDNTMTAEEAVVLNIDYDSSAGTLTCTAGSNTAVLVDGVAGFAIGDLPDSDDESQSVRFALLLSNGFNDIGDAVEGDVLARWNSLSGQSLAVDDEQTHVFQIVQGSVALRNIMQ